MSEPKANIHGSAWTRAAAGWLKKNPWCVMCLIMRRRRKAKHVDHRRPHRGDWSVFWDKTNWQGLCDEHHSSTKQRQEGGRRAAVASEFGADGLPTDPEHPWNAH